MTQDTKEEIGGGILVATTFIVLILGVMFLWSPVTFYLSKWSGYWDEPTSRVPNIELTAQGRKNGERREKAYIECAERTQKYFGGFSEVNSYASSSDRSYEKYDCYGFKWTKIPE